MHGRDLKPSADALMEICKQALHAGIARDYPDAVSDFHALNLEFAYYGDLSNELLLANGRHYDESLDIGDRRNALQALKDIPTRKRFGIRHYDRLPGKTALREFAADMLAPTLGTVGLWLWMCRRCSKDFAEYLAGASAYADGVRERLMSRITKLLDNGDRILLLTHGTGSAVAWDILWSLSHDAEYRQRYGDHKIDLWLTMGAPLGDRQLLKRLRGARNKANDRFPNNIIAWHNVSAEDDYTCHDKTLADDMKRMMRERYVSTVTDYKIYNQAVRYGKSNPHSSVGYLIHPRVVKIITDWMSQD